MIIDHILAIQRELPILAVLIADASDDGPEIEGVSADVGIGAELLKHAEQRERSLGNPRVAKEVKPLLLGNPKPK